MQRQECRAEASGEVGVGSVMPRSVPASLAVKPEGSGTGFDRQSDEKPAAIRRSICGQEDNFSCVARFGHRLNMFSM